MQTKTKPAKPAKAKAHPLLIRQRELQAAIDLECVADTLCINLLRRLQLGAPVEPGSWRIKGCPGNETAEDYKESTGGNTRCGVMILPTSDTE